MVFICVLAALVLLWWGCLMSDRELTQMALNALEAMQSYAAAENKGLRICDEAIEALRARLAQLEQEPVACIVKNCQNHRCEGKFVGDLCSPCHTFIMTGEGIYSQAYRNTQREWQGLTDEEVRDLWSWAMTAEAERTANTQQHAFARAIEAKLKEKNGFS